MKRKKKVMPIWAFCLALIFTSVVTYLIYTRWGHPIGIFMGIAFLLTLLVGYVPLILTDEEDWDYEKGKRKNN